ncbi:hypothetical protein RB601_007889 [Gaeumannomyces tritici]
MVPVGWIRGSGLITAVLLAGQSLAQSCQTAPSVRFDIRMGEGYSSKPIVSGLSRPRGIATDSQGNLLVVEAGSGVRHVKLAESGGSVCVQSSKQLLADSQLTHGIALSPDNKHLYVSGMHGVFQYAYNAVAGTASNRKLIVTDLSNPGTTHATRSLWVSRANPDLLLVHRGSYSNIDPDAAKEETGRAVIRYFNISEIAQTPQPHATGGSLLAMGVRNTVAFGENVARGEFWSVDNSIDDMRRFGAQVNNDNPAEKMNFHGAIELGNKHLGGNFGYPTCVAAWRTDTLSNGALRVGSQIAVDVGSGQDAAALDAACQQKFLPPRLSFPSHNAPLDVKFTADGKHAFIAFHGSWNRSPPDGYRVVRVDMGADGQPVQAADSTNPGTVVMRNANNAACSSGCFRPVGLAIDAKGRMFMSSDSTGEIYVISGGAGLGN